MTTSSLLFLERVVATDLTTNVRNLSGCKTPIDERTVRTEKTEQNRLQWNTGDIYSYRLATPGQQKRALTDYPRGR